MNSQSVKDALADAETLRLFTDVSKRNSEAIEEIYIGVASAYGARARYWLRQALDWCPRWPDEPFLERQHEAVFATKGAAHSIFRAVPGLRG